MYIASADRAQDHDYDYVYRYIIATKMYVVSMVNASIIAGTLIDELNDIYLTYFILHWACIVIQHNDIKSSKNATFSQKRLIDVTHSEIYYTYERTSRNCLYVICGSATLLKPKGNMSDRKKKPVYHEIMLFIVNYIHSSIIYRPVKCA